tara:strand:+ start:294 stop:473 length:180 start_codon:yes stop_codon:yes gene_type:complete
MMNSGAMQRPYYIVPKWQELYIWTGIGMPSASRRGRRVKINERGDKRMRNISRRGVREE